MLLAVLAAVAACNPSAPPTQGRADSGAQTGDPPGTAQTAAAVDVAALSSAVQRSASWSASAGVYLHGDCALTADQADLGKRGVTADGVFYAAPEQSEVAPPHVRLMLGNLDLAERVLSRGTVTEVKSLETDHVIFKTRLALDAADARWLGTDTIRVAIKPATTGTYGKEYRRELAFYRLGRALDAAGLIPIVERRLALSDDVLAQVDTVLTDEQARKLTRDTDADGRTVLRGSVQLWVEGYGPYIGHRKSANRVLNWAARALHDGVGKRTPRPRPADGDEARPRKKDTPVEVTRDPMWQALSDMFVLDFLVYNSDRSMEAGSVRLPDGGQSLVMLDNGDTLMLALHKGTDTSREHFEAVELFSPNVIDALDTLDDDALAALLVDLDGEPLLKAKGMARLAARVSEARKRIAKLERSVAPDGTVRFGQPSRSRGHLCR